MYGYAYMQVSPFSEFTLGVNTDHIKWFTTSEDRSLFILSIVSRN